MGKAAGVPAAIVRGLDASWFREGVVPRAGPPAAGRPVPVTHRPTLPAFLEARRSIRAFTDEPVDADALDAIVAAACIAPAPHHSRPWRFATVTTRRRRRTRSPRGWARAGGPTSSDDGVDAGARRRAGRRVAPQAHRRARARARVPHVERPRPLPRRGPPARRVGHGAAVARRRGREPHARGRRRRPRVVLGRGADLLPRRSPRTRSRSRPSGDRRRSCMVGHPDPAYVGRPRPPVPLDELRSAGDPELPSAYDANSGTAAQRCGAP